MRRDALPYGRAEMTDPIPPAVAKAICAVMAEVPKLARGERNTHGNYNFASIDDFLEAIRPLCASTGLIILQNESMIEARDGWLTLRYDFILAHESGETWTQSLTRNVMVSAKMGAQAFGAAQSYALKQFMRSLFQVATGEKGQDMDEHPASDLPERRQSRQQPQPNLLRLQYGDFADPWAYVEAFERRVEQATTVSEINAVMKASLQDLEDLKAEDVSAADSLRDIIKARKEALSGKNRGEPRATRGKSAPATEATIPEAPGMIPVPLKPDGSTAWGKWVEAYREAFGTAKTPEALKAWRDANEAPLKNLAVYSKALGDQVEEDYKRCLGNLSQAPLDRPGMPPLD